MPKFSAKFLPTALFSLKNSNATNSGAKSLLLPSPYSIKMAILNQAILVGNDLEVLEQKKSTVFDYIKQAKITYHIESGSCFSVNNSFLKIHKPARSGGGFQQTVAYREYVHISNPIELIFEVTSEEAETYLKEYIFRINYFGKKGCFFQFLEYSNSPQEANVKPFDINEAPVGILQEYDDFDPSVSFEQVNSYSSKKTKRKKEVLVLPLKSTHTSKGYTVYECI
ncbi:hypothetical protein [Flammeovirga sp. EKP202]|uniref:hypothetical protein n=1 Tax=Flammeovirga sp. EKP202 TaxID=2770592 RepID=UPI00165F0A1A|nr:hypothetical protein [Flammeovirga sp. EKP202]MBD0402739.1 hypothetical protein [Flammeovirga sp. EKP202]